MKTEQIEIIRFEDFEHHAIFFDLDIKDITYGDATYTLVTPSHLLGELSRHDEDPEVCLLIKEVKKINGDILIALPG